MLNLFVRKWLTALKVVPFAALAIALKILFHQMGWEVFPLSPLFTGLIAANVFLLGFLISGVLVDYKEGEKIPGDLATSIESLFQEVSLICQNKKAKPAMDCLEHILNFTASLKDWFYKKEPTVGLLNRLTRLNNFFLVFEPLTQASYIVRMKNDQSAIRRSVIRADTIRETSFVPSGYAIAEATIIVVTLGLLLTQIEPFYESLFFVGLIVFLLTYMISLIVNLENPFDYSSKLGVQDEVSLKPLADVEQRMKELLSAL